MLYLSRGLDEKIKQNAIFNKNNELNAFCLLTSVAGLPEVPNE